MTAEAPDPRTFKTWENAFQFPIPVVRKLEQQLRGNAGENREKLRSLVGTSYRDLLSTAETIIDMEVRMQRVESSLAKVGHNCSTKNLDRIVRNAAQSHAHNREIDVGRYTFTSQLSVLRSCPVVMARLMKNEGSYLLIAKVLVISRLLHKALNQKQEKPPIVDRLRDKLGSLRSRLLRSIDKRLAAADGDSEMLVESMCAYSLATSSTPTDVLRHFHHVRMERITGSLRHEDGLKEHGINALKLCLQTCQDTQAIFPRRLADALVKLKAHPLAQDPGVRGLYELDLDIHDRWIGDEARNYTPQPRHDELRRPETEKLLHQWSRQAVSAFLKGIKHGLEGTKDLKEVAELRQEVMETWIVSGSRMAGVKSKNVLDDLRETMSGQLASIVRSRTQELRFVVKSITSTLSGWEDRDGALTLWTATATSIDLSNGAQVFKERILNTYQGRDDAVIIITTMFDKWMESVLEVKGIVKHMKETRWDDPFTDDVELSDSDDEFGGASRQMLLSDDDPRLLEEATQDALSDALASLGQSFFEVVGEPAAGEGSQNKFSKAIFMIRVIREISERIPRLRINDKDTPQPTPFTKDILKPLYTTIAQYVILPALQSYQKSLPASTNRRSKSHILWEGHPSLPTQPSPSTFRFLQGLVTRMGSCGGDLWSQEGARILKRLASEEFARIWQEAMKGIQNMDEIPIKSSSDQLAEVEENEGKNEEPNTSVETPSADELKAEKLKQLLFDILYVQRYLSTESELDPARLLMETLSKASGVNESGMARLRKSAGDYARKTYLLFALLA